MKSKANAKLLSALEDVKDLISKESHYSRAAFARDKDGNVVDPTSPKAKAWDVVGGLRKVLNVTPDNMREDKTYIAAVAVLYRANKYRSVCQTNDVSHASAKKLVDLAIKNYI